MYTRIGAILGSLVGGVLVVAAFWGGLGSMGAKDEGDAMEHLAFALMILFTVPVFLLGNIIGTTTGTFVGARIDRRRGKESIIRRVLGVAYIVIGALCIVFALPGIILGASSLHEDPGIGWLVTGIGIAAMAVGVALCFAGWRVGRHKKQAEEEAA